MIKAAIFDIGGVLANDVWEHLLLDDQKSVAAIYKLDRELVRSVANELWKHYAYVIRSESWQELEEEYWTRLSQLLGMSVRVSELKSRTADFIKPVEGMAVLLGELRSKGVGLAVCSDYTKFWYHHQAERIALNKYVPDEKVVLSCYVGKPKSSLGFEIFSEAVKKLGIEKEKCVFVDDRCEKVVHALHYGFTGILFPSESPCGAKYLRALFERMNLL